MLLGFRKQQQNNMEQTAGSGSPSNSNHNRWLSQPLFDFWHKSSGRKDLERTSSDPDVSPTASIKSFASSSTETLYPDPPDGGYGWVVVFAAFMAFLFADGLQLSVGLIFGQIQKEFDASKGQSAVISALFLGVPLLAAPLVSPLIDAYDCRLCTIVGGFITFLGVFLSVFAPDLLTLAFTFGIVTGFGMSFIFSAPMIAVTYYFDRRRAMASGIAASGSGFGTIIFAPICEKLFESYGWQGALLILSALMLNLVVCGVLIRDLEWPEDTIEYKTDKFLKALDLVPSQSRLSRETSVSAMTTIGFVPRNMAGFPSIWPNFHDVTIPCEAVRNAISLVELPCFVREYLANETRHLTHETRGSREFPTHKNKRELMQAGAVKAPQMSKSTAAMPFPIPTGELPRRVHRRSYRLSESEPDDLDSGSESSAGVKTRSMMSFIPEVTEDGRQGSATGQRSGSIGGQGSRHKLKRNSPSRAAFSVSGDEGEDDIEHGNISFASDERQKLLKSSKKAIIVDFSQSDPLTPQPPVSETSGQGSCREDTNSQVSVCDGSAGRLLSGHELPVPTPVGRLPFSTDDLGVGGLQRNRGMSEFVGLPVPPLARPAKHVSVYYHLRSQLAFSRYNAAKRVLSAPELRKLLRFRRQRTFKQRVEKFGFEARATLRTDLDLLKSKSFLVFFWSHFLLYVFNDIPYVNTPDWTEVLFDGQRASLLVSILGVFNTIGMIFFGIVADKKVVNSSLLMAVATIVSGVAVLVVPYLPRNRFVGYALVTVFFGFFMGAADGLTSVILVEICSLSGFVYAYGLVNFASGIGNLCGPTLAGYLYDWTGGYTTTFVVGGIGIILTGLMMAVIPLVHRCEAGRDMKLGSQESIHVMEGKDFVQIQRKVKKKSSDDDVIVQSHLTENGNLPNILSENNGSLLPMSEQLTAATVVNGTIEQGMPMASSEQMHTLQEQQSPEQVPVQAQALQPAELQGSQPAELQGCQRAELQGSQPAELQGSQPAQSQALQPSQLQGSQQPTTQGLAKKVQGSQRQQTEGTTHEQEVMVSERKPVHAVVVV